MKHYISETCRFEEQQGGSRILVTNDYTAEESFTSTCGASERGNASIAVGEASAMCRREASGSASERVAGMRLPLASSYVKWHNKVIQYEEGYNFLNQKSQKTDNGFLQQKRVLSLM